MTYFILMADDSSGGAEHQAYLNLVRTHERVNRDLARFFEERGTTATQFQVLQVLHREGGGLSCQEIGEHMLKKVPDVTRLLDRLEKAGLISRSRCERDRRVVRSGLTERGRELVETTEGPLAEARRALLGGLDEGEVKMLRDLLEKASSDSGD
jgi:DNA-binding MarR family transcriptional regulator